MYVLSNLRLSIHYSAILKINQSTPSWRLDFSILGRASKGGFMTPPPNIGFFRVILDGWSQILPSTKLFHHRFIFEQTCSAMETKKLEETVQQHDEDAESSKTGCRSPSRAHGKDCEQMSALICDSPPHLVHSCHVGGAILLIGSKIAPPNVWGTNLKLLT